MPKKRKQGSVSETKRQIARITKKRLIILITGLLAALAFFLLKPGEAYWPMWLIDNQRGFITILGIISVLFILMSPIIVVTESDPRPLLGPGKSPYSSAFNSWDEKD
jgi:hypothetical protein